jgi:hypothetical protein
MLLVQTFLNIAFLHKIIKNAKNIKFLNFQQICIVN